MFDLAEVRKLVKKMLLLLQVMLERSGSVWEVVKFWIMYMVSDTIVKKTN